MAVGSTPITNTYVTEGPRGHAGATPAGHQGEREDLADVIERIDPSDVPFYSNASKGTCKAIITDWLVQELAAVDTTNKQPEGFEAAFNAVTAPVRFNNYTQILANSAIVSGTMDSVDKAGRDREVTYQKILKGLEIRRDLDAILTGDFAKDGVDPRGLGSISSWITNGSVGAGGSLPTGDGSNVPTGGTPAALTLAMINTGMQEAYEDGGQPSIMYFSPKQKAAFSAIDVGGSASATTPNRYNMTSVSPAVYIGTVDTYLTDFGKLECAIDRFMPDDRVYGIDTRHMEVCSLPGRNFFTQPLAATGDAEKHLVIWEGTLKVDAPKAHFGCYGLS